MCQGQLLSVSQNTALFALLGTAFGGNGVNTFGLPDLAGRVMVGAGSGVGLSPYVIGEVGGAQDVTLTINNLPMHTHQATFAATPAGTNLTVADAPSTTQQASSTPGGSMLARSIDGATTPAAKPQIYAPNTATPTTTLAGVNVAGTVTVATTGNSQSFSIVQPFTCVTAVIATQGVFPSRN